MSSIVIIKPKKPFKLQSAKNDIIKINYLVLSLYLVKNVS